MDTRLVYGERKGAMHMIVSDDPWRDIILSNAKWARPEHLGQIYIDGLTHTIIDTQPTYGDADGFFLTWEHGESGEQHVSGHVDGETRHWVYEEFVAWRKRRVRCQTETAKHHRHISGPES